MDRFQTISSVLALLISGLALTISMLSYRQAKRTSLLTMRRDVIEHVRNALEDVSLHGQITRETVDSLRDALQLAQLVFSAEVRGVLDEAHGISFRLQHKSFDQRTDADDEDQEKLETTLNRALKMMVRDTSLSR
jgi:hypothetical protein